MGEILLKWFKGITNIELELRRPRFCATKDNLDYPNSRTCLLEF